MCGRQLHRIDLFGVELRLHGAKAAPGRRAEVANQTGQSDQCCLVVGSRAGSILPSRPQRARRYLQFVQPPFNGAFSLRH